MYELDSTRNWYADWQWGGDWSYGKKQRKTFLHEPSCNFWFLNNGNSTGIKIFYIYIFFEKNWLSIATGAWKTTTFAAPFSSPPALEILPGPERQQRWSLGGQLYKQSMAPTLPRWFTQLRNSFSLHIAGRVDKAQMALDLHLHECFSKFSTQATLRQKSPKWGDDRQPRDYKELP